MEAVNEHWRGGDIANLKPARLFPLDQYNALLAPGAGCTRGYLDVEACGHPVIILLRLSERSTHAMITPISSHGSNRMTECDCISFSLPWARRRNRHKNAEHYRAFDGTPRPSTRRRPLYLEGDAMLPMPNASWVDIQKVWVLPLAVLRRLSTDGGQRWVPRMQRESLIDLRAHMSEECARWKEHMRRLLSVEPTPAALPVALSPGSASEVSTSKGSWAAIVVAATAEPPPAAGKEEQQAAAALECERDGRAPSPASSPISTPGTRKISEDDGSDVETIAGSAEALLPPPSVPAPGAKGGNSDPQSDVNPDKAAALKSSWACVAVAPAPAPTLNGRQRIVLRKGRVTAAPSSACQRTGSVLPIPPLTEDLEIVRLTTLQDASTAIVDRMAPTTPPRLDCSLPSAPANSGSAASSGLAFALRPTAPAFVPAAAAAAS
ncbi:hypothetical protein OQA88_4461 [Cercophora sp. LCS_1]